MYYNLQKAKKPNWQTYILNSAKLNSRRSFCYCSLFFHKTSPILLRFPRRFLSIRQLFIVLSFSLPLMTSFSSQALSTKTTNTINGTAPYFTTDGGQTRITDAEGLLEISLSNGDKYTPLSNDSSPTKPIVLPIAGQSFADIGMLVPTDSDSIELNSLIGDHYWGDSDGDGEGPNGITATGGLSLSIVDKDNQAVSRDTIPKICNAPYKVTLTSTDGTLETNYGVPKSSHFAASNVTYYISPKASPIACFAKPNMKYSDIEDGQDFKGLANEWDPKNGFIPQSYDPSSYNQNFPTTGANGLYFDLKIGGVNQKLTWTTVSHGEIKVTMRYLNESDTSVVRVTLKGPTASQDQIRASEDQIMAEANLIGTVEKPTLPQVFELVGKGKDSNDNDVVVKYGFELKQWFVNRGDKQRLDKYPSDAPNPNDQDNKDNKPGSEAPYMQEKWCEKIGYSLSKIKDLTNAKGAECPFVDAESCEAQNLEGASIGNYYQRKIAGGLLSEWGVLGKYEMDEGNFDPNNGYWTSDMSSKGINVYYLVSHLIGKIYGYSNTNFKRTAICTTN